MVEWLLGGASAAVLGHLDLFLSLPLSHFSEAHESFQVS